MKCSNCCIQKFFMEQEDILEELPFKILIEIRDMFIIKLNKKAYLKFYNNCKEYIEKAEDNPLEFIDKSCSEWEIGFLTKAVKNAGILSTPVRLAKFLETDKKKLISAVETGKIPAFKYGRRYYIKTLEILPHIDKLNL